MAHRAKFIGAQEESVLGEDCTFPRRIESANVATVIVNHSHDGTLLRFHAAADTGLEEGKGVGKK